MKVSKHSLELNNVFQPRPPLLQAHTLQSNPACVSKLCFDHSMRSNEHNHVTLLNCSPSDLNQRVAQMKIIPMFLAIFFSPLKYEIQDQHIFNTNNLKIDVLQPKFKMHLNHNIGKLKQTVLYRVPNIKKQLGLRYLVSVSLFIPKYFFPHQQSRKLDC